MAVALVVGIALLIWLAKQPRSSYKPFLIRFVIPVAMVFAPVGILMMLENHAVTGSAFSLPHLYYRSQVAVWPNFLFQHPREAFETHFLARLPFLQARFV